MNETTELKNVVALDLVRTNSKVIAAGPITLQPHSRPYRIVMLNWGDKFSVHTEYFEVSKDVNFETLAEACAAAETHFDGGHYFNTKEFDKAVRIFGDALEHHARFVESIYRELV